MAYNINSIRENFPILKTLVYNKPLVYFDNAATTQKPDCVIRKITYMYEQCNANVHRGVHYLSAMATDEMEAARETVRQFINARNSCEIVFTRGTTEAINLVAFSFAEAFLGDGDEIIVTEMEHHSNLVPWQMACQRRGARLVKWPISNKGELVAG
ncbi:MAG TPA: aminotransferase class V-fold PLP-dependent enzyme, partial [Bacteroidales bacterium]|nr:aminotransferase class V-fold PLP-dependent enzyme [Bacteroidales bacterium]